MEVDDDPGGLLPVHRPEVPLEPHVLGGPGLKLVGGVREREREWVTMRERVTTRE